ncbi:MAG: K+ channel, inward rectifier [Flavobacteriales bacterium]|nr:K+ channel, inward rectifier [Flavobacteriales bacterium]
MAEEKKEDFHDLGLGSKASSSSFRSLNKDGTFNVNKYNVSFFEKINFFHSLISMSWPKFIGIILLGYLVVNTIFASIYYFIGVEFLTGIEATSPSNQFIEVFFFSAQTVTTLGYGRVAPIGNLANIVAAIESMLGLLSFALATGMLYGRFSKPSAKLKYSTPAVIAPYQDLNAFMFRIVNPQNNQLLEVEVSISLSMQRANTEFRDFFLLKLERSSIAFLPYTWTIVHPIDEKSPLHLLNASEMAAKDVEFIIMIKAFDESFSQTVYSRSSYKASEIKWGHKFVKLAQAEKNGIGIDVSRLDETEKVQLNS